MSGEPRETLPEDVRAARGYVDVAREDLRKGLDLSACLTAEKAAEVALQGWVRSRGQDAGVDALPTLLAGVPGAREPRLQRAVELLDRFRMDLHSAYRSAGLPDATPELADACCLAAAEVVTHVERLFAAEATADEIGPAEPGFSERGSAERGSRPASTTANADQWQQPAPAAHPATDVDTHAERGSAERGSRSSRPRDLQS